MADSKNEHPGVDVSALSAFPQSIPGVATAIPIFIGYTEAAAIGGKAAFFNPILINSLTDYRQYFGAGYEPRYLITAAAKAPYDVTAMLWDGANFQPANYRLAKKGSPPVLASFNLYNSVRLFYANGGGPCYVVSVGAYKDAVDAQTGNVTIDAATLTQGLTVAGEQAGPTITVIPDAVLLKGTVPKGGRVPISSDFQTLVRTMLGQCGTLLDRVALLDVYGTEAIDTADKAQRDLDLAACIANFQAAVGEANLSYGAAYFPFLEATVVPTSEVDYTVFNAGADNLALLQTILTSQAAYLYPSADPAKAGPALDDNPIFLALAAQIKAIATTLAPDNTPEELKAVRQLNQNLVNAVPLLQQMENIVAAKMNLLPASGAMAGIFALNDATRGVWNASANMAVSQVLAPSVPVNAEQQGPINVPVNGKSVNVIRDFAGRGTVVWGARTLDGNSLDYRYIQVRRTLIYIEQSITQSLQPFAFAANDGATWVAVTAMISGFLQNLWAQGGLMGDKASDAYTVQCGLGSTMTGQDILNGYMIVQVTLQMVRPAEFIELTFKQKMQSLG
ncbi:MAG TPA: phage tail sheath C-terminal domain-containing protein [Rhizomicrobium sp.]|jgi:phage tail sheath protein FI|nr:phage tail sheath C-terminal domain-containing protein [Rhizomicrobium sp.]